MGFNGELMSSERNVIDNRNTALKNRKGRLHSPKKFTNFGSQTVKMGPAILPALRTFAMFMMQAAKGGAALRTSIKRSNINNRRMVSCGNPLLIAHSL